MDASRRTDGITASRASAVLLCLLVFSAGCVDVTLDATSDASDGDDSDGAPAIPGTPVEGVTATVVDVVDGDTLDVRYSNGETDTIRLLGVDTPEVHVENEPAEFEGVPERQAGEECLREAGDVASGALTKRLDGERVTVVADPVADRRDRYGRLLAYVEANGTDLNHWLIAEGHARVYDSTFSRSERYYESETDAQRAGIGVWQCRAPDSARFETVGIAVVTEFSGD